MSRLTQQPRSAERRLCGVTVPPRVLAVAALCGATAIWGTSFAVGKTALASFPPFTLACFRLAIAWVLLRAVAHRTGSSPRRGRQSALLGLTGVALLIVCQNLGLRTASAADAVLVMDGGFPVLAGLLALALLGERFGRRSLAALLASVAGVVAVVLLGGGARGGPLSGDLLILASAGSAAVYAVVGRRAFAENLLGVVTGSTGYGALMLAPVAAVELLLRGCPNPSLGALALALYLGAGCSGLAYLFWGYSLRHLSALDNAVIGNVEILVGLAAAVALGERLTATHLIGAGLVLGGAAVAAVPERAASRRQVAEEPMSGLAAPS